MKSSDRIDKLKKEHLEWLLINQRCLEKVPEDTDREIIKRLKAQRGKLEKEKSDKVISVSWYRQFAAAAIIMIVLFTGTALYLFKTGALGSDGNLLTGTVIKSSGEILISGRSPGNYKNKTFALKNQTIKAGKDSQIDMKIGGGSFIYLSGSSEARIKTALRNKNNEFSSVYLKKGKIICQVKLATKESGFEILTDCASYKVKGTEFEVIVDENLDTTLNVRHGTVEAGNYIKPAGLTDGRSYSDELKSIINDARMITENGSLTIVKSNADRFNLRLKELAEKINNNLIGKDKLESEINILSAEKETIFANSDKQGKTETGKNGGSGRENNQADYAPEIKKLNIGLNTVFSETETAATTDGGKYILITSNRDKTVYCIDISEEKLKWKFTDKKIANVTSPAVFFNGNAILCTPESMFVINQTGKTADAVGLPDGPSYWAYPAVYNGRLFIPGFSTVYVYGNTGMNMLDDSLNINGQIYFNCRNNSIYFTAANERKVKKYSLSDKKIVWESPVLQDMSFMMPLVINDEVYVSDIKDSIYKFNLKKGTSSALKSDAGVISGLIFSNGFIYYTANNGYFYRVNAAEFTKPEKIVRLDDKPVMDKYLVKKALLNNDKIYYLCDTGKVFIYDTLNNREVFVSLTGNMSNALIASPLKTAYGIIFADSGSNIYKIF